MKAASDIIFRMVDLSQIFFQASGHSLTREQESAFQTYEDELIDWNEKFNLTAIRDRDGIRVKHFLDSLTLLPFIENKVDTRLIDIGTGAGFPGLPIKIMMPAIQLTLVDSVGKKLEFCRHLAGSLRIEQVSCVQARAEDLGQAFAHRQNYSHVTARAVAALPVLVEYLLPLLRLGGIAIIQKGESGPAETNSARKAIRVLGGELEKIMPVNLPGVAETRYVILIRKIAATPPAYPRRAGIPAKKPIS